MDGKCISSKGLHWNFAPRQCRRDGAGPKQDPVALHALSQRAGHGAHRARLREDEQPDALNCVHEVGPGATNMATGSGRWLESLSVLLLPGDIFAKRTVAPVLQQLEFSGSQDVSVNDCFKPISRYWDRVDRPEQILTSLPEAISILTSPARPVPSRSACRRCQAERRCQFPRTGSASGRRFPPRPQADRGLLATANGFAKRLLVSHWAASSTRKPSAALAEFVSQTGIPVGETQAGKGSLPYDHPQQLGAVGVTFTPVPTLPPGKQTWLLALGFVTAIFTTASKTVISMSYRAIHQHKYRGV